MDSFAFGPGRRKEEKEAARSSRVRNRHGVGRIVSAILPAPILFLFAMVVFAVGWTSFAFAASGRVLSRPPRNEARATKSRAPGKRRRAMGAVTLVLVGSIAFGIPSPANAAISFVKTVGSDYCGGTTSTITVPADGVAARNTLLISVGLRNVSSSGAISAADSKGNTYTVDASETGAFGTRAVILSGFISTALAPGDTITVSHDAGASESVVVAEFFGIARTDRVDATGGAWDSTPTPTASLTTTNDDDLLFGNVVRRVAGTTFTEDPDWTTHNDAEVNCGGPAGTHHVHDGYRSVASAGTYSYTVDMGSGAEWSMVMVAYKAGDTTPPVEPTLTTSPSSPDNDETPTWGFTGEAGGVFECQLLRGATVISPLAACTSDVTYNIAAQVDATYTFSVRQVDSEGNIGQFRTSTYVLDRAAPTEPTLEGGPGTTGSDRTPEWTFSTEAGATTACELRRGATVISPYGPCTSPASFDLSTQPDGTYTFRVRATDGAGNTGSPLTDSYTLDTTGASVDITDGPGAAGTDATPTWSFTPEAGATTECELSRGATVVSPYEPCTSPVTFNLSSDDTYTFSVRATDGLGNTGEPSSLTYTLDTDDPDAPSIDSGPADPSSEDTPAWAFTAETGATTECELTRGAAVLSPYAPCTSPVTIDISTEPDGTYTFSVRATDGVGQTGPSATDSYALDRDPPAAPSIDSGPTSPSSDDTPEWVFSADAGTTTECELSMGAVVIDPFGPCASPQGYDLTTEADGEYTFRVRARDAADNLSDSAAAIYTLDRTPPDAPTILSSPSSPGNNPNPSWSFSTEVGATAECELSRGGSALSPWAPCASPMSYDISGEQNGNYTFRVRAVDAADNTGPVSADTYSYDATGPNVTFTSTPASPANDLGPSWSFTTEAGATTECELSHGTGVVSPYAPCASPQSYDLSGRPDGAYTISVRATDTVGNTGAAEADIYVLDTTAPTATITSAPLAVSSDQTPTWEFVTEAGASTECELAGPTGVLAPFASCDGPETYDLSTQPDGAYTFTVRATDPAGNPGSPAGSTYTLDTSGPGVNITSSPSSPGSSRTPQWTFTAEAGSTTECELALGGSVVHAYASCTSPIGYDLTGQPDGDYTLSIRATDEAGNVGAPAGDVYTLDTTAPAEPSITTSPASPSNSLSPSWSFIAEAGAFTECELRSGGATLSPWGSCGSPSTYDLTGAPDGSYTFAVRAVDAAGNSGPQASSTYELDTAGPVVAITSRPSSPGNDPSPLWSFSTEAGATVECELSATTGVLLPYAPCDSPATYDLTGWPDGGYTLQVRATDTVGNLGSSVSDTYLLDTAPPVVMITSAPPSPGTSTNPTWAFSTEVGAGTECELQRGSTVLSAWRSCTSPTSYDISGEPDGDYVLRVRASDDAGNEGPGAMSTYTLETPADEPPPNEETHDDETSPPDAPAVFAPAEAAPETTAPTEREEPRRERDRRDGKAEPEPDPVEVVTASFSPPPQNPGVLGDILANVSTVVAGLLAEPAFPLILIALVIAFLVLQNRIDRRDPKLAMAPVYPDPHLYFNAQDDPSKGR